MWKQIALGMALLAGLLVGTAWGDEALNKALFDAAASGNQAQVMALLAKGANVNAKDDSGATALHFAADRGDRDIVELLIAKGANVNAKTKGGWTPLDLAEYALDESFFPDEIKGYEDLVKFLIAKGAKK